MMTSFREAAVCKGNLKSERRRRQCATALSFITLGPKKVTRAMELLALSQ